MNRSVAILGVLAALGVAAAGCDLTDTPPREGTFALRSIAGEPLPAARWENENVDALVLEETLILFADGTAEDRTTILYQYRNGTTPSEVDRSTTKLVYQTANGELRLDYPCDDTGDCITGPHLVGRLTEDGLQLDQALYFRVPMVFERID